MTTGLRGSTQMAVAALAAVEAKAAMLEVAAVEGATV